MTYYDEYTKTNYDVEFDKKEVKKLIDEIIKTVAIRTKGTFYEFSSSVGQVLKNGSLSRPLLENKSPKYVDVEDVSYFSSGMDNGYYHDTCCIRGTKVEIPSLVILLNYVLAGKGFAIRALEDYRDNPEMVPLEVRIQRMKEQLDQMDYSDPQIPSLIKRYQSLLETQERNDEVTFDRELLGQCYAKAFEVIHINSKTKVSKAEMTLRRDNKGTNF